MQKILILFLCLFLIGCATSGKLIDQDKLSQIKEGITTKEEVINLLGKPEMISLTSDAKEIMMYHHLEYKTRASTFIPVVGLMTGGADMKQQILQILIDKNGKVEKFIFNDSGSKINSGLLNTK